jgi:hypothetical protein
MIKPSIKPMFRVGPDSLLVRVHVYDPITMKSVTNYIMDINDKAQRAAFAARAHDAYSVGQTISTQGIKHAPMQG